MAGCLLQEHVISCTQSGVALQFAHHDLPIITQDHAALAGGVLFLPLQQVPCMPCAGVGLARQVLCETHSPVCNPHAFHLGRPLTSCFALQGAASLIPATATPCIRHATRNLRPTLYLQHPAKCISLTTSSLPSAHLRFHTRQQRTYHVH